MPMITLIFNYPEAPLPQYKFGDRVAVTGECPPNEWLIGKIVGLTLHEAYEPIWYYSIKLDAPSGLTEEYQADDLVLETQIPVLQAEWEQQQADWRRENPLVATDFKPLPKFKSGTLVKFSEESGCSVPGDYAEVVSSRYVSSEDWSGFVYKLSNERLNQPIEIGETWLVPVSEVPLSQS